jgi:hypothetical protein
VPPPKPPRPVELTPHLPHGPSLLQDITGAAVDHRSTTVDQDRRHHRAPACLTVTPPFKGVPLTTTLPDATLGPTSARRPCLAADQPPQRRHTSGLHAVTALRVRLARAPCLRAMGRFPGWARRVGRGCGPKPAQHCALSFLIFQFRLHFQKFD